MAMATVSFCTLAGGKRGGKCGKCPRKVKNARANRFFSAHSGFRARKRDFARAEMGEGPRKPENRRAK
jgi:hypothetical protein